MNSACSHPKPRRPDLTKVQKLIVQAEARCTAEGQRWTEPRRRVFELLLQSAAPMKAYDLIAAYDDNEPGSTKPPTVYRALEFLEGFGLAHRVPSLNAYVACGGAKTAHPASFLICDCCGSAQEFVSGAAELASALALARAKGFQPRAAAVEVRGVCRSCAAKG